MRKRLVILKSQKNNDFYFISLMNGRDILVICNFVFGLVGAIGACVYCSIFCARYFPWMKYAGGKGETFINTVMAEAILAPTCLVITWVCWIFSKKGKVLGWIMKITIIAMAAVQIICTAIIISVTNGTQYTTILTEWETKKGWTVDNVKDYADFINNLYSGMSASEIIDKKKKDLELLSYGFLDNIQIFYYFQLLFAFITIYQIFDSACCGSSGELESKLTV